MFEAQVNTVAELTSAYEGEWLALEVQERDENGLPVKAKLVARASSRLELREQVKDRDGIYIKYAGSITPTQEFGFIY